MIVDDEIAAYHQLHSMLWAKHAQHNVAIYRGQMVDHDADGVALSLRIYQQYPNQFVLIRQVEAEAESLLRIRSPRFVEGAATITDISQ